MLFCNTRPDLNSCVEAWSWFSLSENHIKPRELSNINHAAPLDPGVHRPACLVTAWALWAGPALLPWACPWPGAQMRVP